MIFDKRFFRTDDIIDGDPLDDLSPADEAGTEAKTTEGPTAEELQQRLTDAEAKAESAIEARQKAETESEQNRRIAEYLGQQEQIRAAGESRQQETVKDSFVDPIENIVDPDDRVQVRTFYNNYIKPNMQQLAKEEAKTLVEAEKTERTQAEAARQQQQQYIERQDAHGRWIKDYSDKQKISEETREKIQEKIEKDSVVRSIFTTNPAAAFSAAHRAVEGEELKAQMEEIKRIGGLPATEKATGERDSDEVTMTESERKQLMGPPLNLSKEAALRALKRHRAKEAQAV